MGIGVSGPKQAMFQEVLAFVTNDSDGCCHEHFIQFIGLLCGSITLEFKVSLIDSISPREAFAPARLLALALSLSPLDRPCSRVHVRQARDHFEHNPNASIASQQSFPHTRLCEDSSATISRDHNTTTNQTTNNLTAIQLVGK